MCYLKRVTWNVRKYAQEFMQGKKKPTDYVEKEIEEKNKSACYLKPYKVQLLQYTCIEMPVQGLNQDT